MRGSTRRPKNSKCHVSTAHVDSTFLVMLSATEAFEIILNPGERVCTEIPRGCRKDATFVLGTSCFNHPDDFKADDNGSFHHHGSKSEFMQLDDDSNLSRIDDPKDPKPGE